MRILFMGTPEFAVPSLKRLTEDGHTLCGVFTQPDKPKNRGMKLTFSPVKEYALSRDLPVYQPLKVKDGEALRIVRELAPDLIVVAAYGKILPEAILNTPKYGSINVHSSLLPKYRGAAPINWAILNGEKETGVSIMYMTRELDAGDLLRTVRTPIGPGEDARELTARLAKLGAEALAETILTLADGTAVRTPQDADRQTYAPMLTRALSPIDWTKDHRTIRNQVRGLIPWPCASAVLDGKSFKVFRTEEGNTVSAAPGTVVSAGNSGIEVACGDGRSLFITELQAEGGKRMPAGDYLRGHPMKI
jgi:methionyl-tRNA formyltransferase